MTAMSWNKPGHDNNVINLVNKSRKARMKTQLSTREDCGPVCQRQTVEHLLYGREDGNDRRWKRDKSTQNATSLWAEGIDKSCPMVINSDTTVQCQKLVLVYYNGILFGNLLQWNEKLYSADCTSDILENDCTVRMLQDARESGDTYAWSWTTPVVVLTHKGTDVADDIKSYLPLYPVKFALCASCKDVRLEQTCTLRLP